MAYPDLDFEKLRSRGALEKIDGLLLLGLKDRPDCKDILDALAISDVRCIGFVPSHYSDIDLGLARSCGGYVMLQAAPGATGPRKNVDKANQRKIAELKSEGITCPILLGFGISTPEQAREACDLGADGVVIGSACVRLALQGPSAVRDFVGSVRQILGD
jgi:tryptophan synthase alpha subunit